MTIIVAAVGVGMCADTLCSYEDGSHYYSQKIYRQENELIGLAGSSDECYKWLYWYQDGAKPKKRPRLHEFSGLILRKDAILMVEPSCYVTPLDNRFYGIGIGFDSAMGVMESVKKPTQATLQRAVKIACKLNRWCGYDEERGPQFEKL